MKFSEKWLREWVNPPLSTDDLVSQITMAGLEVDGVEPVADKLSQVVVGEIVDTKPHPNADKLQVCLVSKGDETVQVVCGAPNARVGIKVPFALVGAKLDDFKIKKAKLRGVESFGMLCSERELGLSDQHEGLMELPADAPLGSDINDYLGLEDVVIEVDLTPNRSDCLGMVGIAREVGLMNNLDVCSPEISAVPEVISDKVAVNLAAGTHCPRFVGRVLKGVNLSVQSPLWLVEKLRRSGIRAIDPVVDVTNYVMLELNQPMHAYDYDKLTGDITVRAAKPAETLTLLNGSQIALAEGSLLITDDSGPIGLAGIMGGASTAVSDSTQDIYLEAAFFAPIAIAGRARGYGLHTDAGHRFERGVDYNGQVTAIERATQLIASIAGGVAGPVVDTVNEAELPSVNRVRLRAARVERVLGMAIDAADIENILKRLEFIFEADQSSDGAAWWVDSPSHRFDITIEADLIEEISRIIGYDALPVTRPVAKVAMIPQSERVKTLGVLKQSLVSRGYAEAITYSFVDSGLQSLLAPMDQAVALKNPLSSEMNVMRASLLPGLLSAVAHNQNRQQLDIRLFEVGMVFRNNEKAMTLDNIHQHQKIAMVITGRRFPERWSHEGHNVDFFDLKGDLQGLIGDRLMFDAAAIPGLQAGQSAMLSVAGQTIGFMGLLEPGSTKAFQLKAPVFVAELDLALAQARLVPDVLEISKYPEVRRDIAILVARNVTAQALRQDIEASAGIGLINLKLFDVYMGEGIDPDKKSVGLGLTFQHPSRTLTDDEVNTAMAEVVSSLSRRFEAELR
ncbi:MAG: phenylalanine--tRNA ligase subunit beta [Pseudomonadales bacterium]|nr:phenylalanine--tRNA ligase subunit beta [Pseudomonadales bacterium]MDA0762101.1 phenylalanine--tRNA ligase subunit beta [Pseudomonadota bacterium]